MTAGGRRTWRRKPGWGETAPLLPPAPPPEGMDLVIGKMRADEAIVRSQLRDPHEDERKQDRIPVFVDEAGEAGRPRRDHIGRHVVDVRYALVGAAVVAAVAAYGFWTFYSVLTAAPVAP